MRQLFLVTPLLALAACNQGKPADPATNNAAANANGVTEVPEAEVLEGTVNDSMTNLDGAAPAGGLANDADAANAANAATPANNAG